METKIVYNEDLHFEHEQWKRELDFWEDELLTFKHRLEEMLAKDLDKTVLSKLDNFENRFRIHENEIRACKQRIYSHELNIARITEKGENAIDRVSYEYHLEFRKQIEIQREMYHQLKKEFFGFLTALMRKG
jgi:hypothetical protein